MHQFFVDASLELNTKVAFDQALAHQIHKVLKLHHGESILLSNTHVMALAHLEGENGTLFAVIDQHQITTTLQREVTLMVALIRKEKFELVLQKATELGVHRIVPLIMERNVVKWDDHSNKLQRYRLILKEAAEQCHRLSIPELIEPIQLKEIDSYKSELNFVAYEGENPSHLLKAQLKQCHSISIVIGPEGGISTKEMDNLEAIGFMRVSLGPRIYRAETAAIVAINTIDCVLGL